MARDLTQVRLATETRFEGKVFRVHRDRVRIPGGAEVVRDVVVHPGAVVIVPRTGAGGVLLVRQYRYAAREALLEFPAGTLEPGEAPEKTAERELQEEVGYRPDRLTWLGEFYSAPGFCNERLVCYLAEGLRPSRLEGDPDEQIEVLEISYSDALRLAANGELRDAKTLAALLLAGAAFGGRGGDAGLAGSG